MFKEKRIIFVGGSKGVGKSTLSKRASLLNNFDYISSGERMRKYWENFHKEFTNEIINLNNSTLIDTHYAASRQKTPYQFEIGMLEENLKKISLNNLLRKRVIYVFSSPELILERRQNDIHRIRCLNLEQIYLENEMNLKYSKIYAELLHADFFIFENKYADYDKNLKGFNDLLK